LGHDQSNIGFEFVALSYTAPQANRYAYKMEGIDENWVYTNSTHSASYAKLPPGKYTFRVRGSNNDGLWNETGTFIEIEILPPWWLSNIALVAYIVMSAFLIYYSLSRYMRKMEEKHTEKRKLFEAEKEKELYNSKIEFFTNIAHEIRTPVTLINGPLELMSEMDIRDPEVTKSLAIMRRNTDELLNLVNKLLDIRKVDSNKFPLYLSSNNISEILRSIYEQFELVVLQQGKSGVLSLPDEDVYTQVDKDVFTRIINNLLSNALRYSDKYLELELTQTEEAAYIRVCNDGELVPEEARDKIFDPFYQVEKQRNSSSGSGIGLYLARSLAELHNGRLYFNEKRGLNEFVLQIPIKQDAAEITSEKIPENDYICPEDEDTSEKFKAEVILVVEDNVEMLSFITGELRKHFGIEKALNGADALKILDEKNIDLILTDVMMPGMNGFELCQTIKNNLNYSHVPIVILTAKNDLNSKIHGLEMGADAYIEKPFAMSHLIAQLTTLLGNRRREKEAFMRRPFLPVQQLGMNKADEQFMQKVIDVIRDNITDPTFNVERLSENVFMSRSNLHRKIKALTELAPTEFIHLIRLKKAAELIQSGEYRIGEIGYLVGILSTSYFIKLFRKQFGLTPKEFAKQQEKE
jgi:signal transduction histidine kinase/DNA-binding response OmpR family regulator